MRVRHTNRHRIRIDFSSKIIMATKGAFTAGIAAGLFATISWGLQLPLARDAFEIVDLYHLTAIRYVAASTILICFLVAKEGFAALRYEKQFYLVSRLGVVGMCGSPVLVFIGMSLSSAEHTVVIVALQPVIAALLVWYVDGRRPAKFTLACAFLAFLGVLLVVTGGTLENQSARRHLIGDAIVFLGALCWINYTMGIGRLSRWSVLKITVLTMVPGCVATVLITTILVQSGLLATPTLSELGQVRWELFFLTFVGILLSMLAWNFGTRRIGPVNATILMSCMPVAAYSYRVAQGYTLLITEVMGAVLVIIALIASSVYARHLEAQGVS